MRNITTIQKIKLYIISLWLLFTLVFIIRIDIPVYFGTDWEVVSFCYLIKMNIIPLICLIFILAGLYFYLSFDYWLNGTGKLASTITSVENVNYKHLTFLSTYIIPLICFNFDNTRYIIVFFLLLIIIGIIYIKTDIFYANPTLALLKFRIYRIQLDQPDNHDKIIIITKDKLSKNDKISSIDFDEGIIYGRKM